MGSAVSLAFVLIVHMLCLCSHTNTWVVHMCVCVCMRVCLCVWQWVGWWADWSSGDWIIYRIFAQWLAGGQTTGALGPVGVDLSLGSSGSLTVTPCVRKNNRNKTLMDSMRKKTIDRTKYLPVNMHVCRGKERVKTWGKQPFGICKHM